MHYMLVRQVDGRLVRTDYPDRDALVRGLADLGFEEQGEERSAVRREELRGQPTFSGLCGPMWGGHVDERGDYVFTGGGEPCIRYEDLGAYATLSA